MVSSDVAGPPDAQGQIELTVLLEAAARGDAAAFDRVFAQLYPELVRLAHAQRRRWRGNETLNTTALVHEAYLKLCRQAELRVTNRVHFFAVAARVMRQILVNYAEQQCAAKRGGGGKPVALSDDVVAEPNPIPPDVALEFLELNGALGRLERLDARQARVVECRFFVGLSNGETAEAMGVSPATVKRDWSLASAWLYRELGGRPPGGAGPARSRYASIQGAHHG